VTGTVLVTGATGFVGSAIVAAVHRSCDAPIMCLVRGAGPPQRLAKLARALAQQGVDASDPRITIVGGDVREQRLGMASADWTAAVETVDCIIHSAALIGFLQPAEILARVNVGGTAHAIELAHSCAAARPSFRRFVLVSTAYVAGRRRGRVLESDPPHDRGFKNPYELSKQRAEALVRASSGTLPVTIVRPSIVTGPAKGAAATSGHSLGAAIKMMVDNDSGWIPVRGRCPVDFVPVDYVAEATVALSALPAAAGGTFHLVSGGRHPRLLADYIHAINAHARDGRPPLRTIPPWVFTRLLAPLLRRSTSPAARKSLLYADAYLPYFTRNPQFDDRATAALLAEAGLVPPDPMAVFVKILAQRAGRRYPRTAPAMLAAGS